MPPQGSRHGTAQPTGTADDFGVEASKDRLDAGDANATVQQRASLRCVLRHEFLLRDAAVVGGRGRCRTVAWAKTAGHKGTTTRFLVDLTCSLPRHSSTDSLCAEETGLDGGDGDMAYS